MIYLDDETDEVIYERSNWNIFDGNVMNMYLIILGVKYVAIDTDDSLCNGYYIIKFSSYPYTLQSEMSIDGQGISSSKMVCEGPYFFTININYNYYILQRTKSIHTIVSLRKTINGNINVIFYYQRMFFHLV